MAWSTFYSLKHFVQENVHQTLAQRNFTCFCFWIYKHCFLIQDTFTRSALMHSLRQIPSMQLKNIYTPPKTICCKRESSPWSEGCQNTRLILDNDSSLNFLQTLISLYIRKYGKTGNWRCSLSLSLSLCVCVYIHRESQSVIMSPWK